ncbi:MAG: hypothetical protein AAF184_14590 [Pseudomonadota bacterium]
MNRFESTPPFTRHAARMVTCGLTLLGACASVPPTPPSGTDTLTPVGPALDTLARQLIERVERESNCRYLLAGRRASPTPGASFSVLLLSYRGPEVECRQGLEALNRHGAPQGVTFVAARLRLAEATPGGR